MQRIRTQRTSTGRVIRARFLNELVDAANATQGVRAPREALSTSGPVPMTLRRAEIVTVSVGYLLCTDPDIGQGAEARRTFYVAMPSLFRATAHDGVTYVYTDGNTRTASKSGETDETHVLTPSYVAGDMITAASPVEFGSGLVGVPTTEDEVELIDLNLDGRQWAKSA